MSDAPAGIHGSHAWPCTVDDLLSRGRKSSEEGGGGYAIEGNMAGGTPFVIAVFVGKEQCELAKGHMTPITPFANPGKDGS